MSNNDLASASIFSSSGHRKKNRPAKHQVILLWPVAPDQRGHVNPCCVIFGLKKCDVKMCKVQTSLNPMIYHSLSLFMMVYQCLSNNIIFSHQIAIFGCFRESSISNHSQKRPENTDGSDRWAGRRLISGGNPCQKWSSQGRAFKWFQANTQTWKLHFNGRNPSFLQHFPPTKSTSKDSVKWSVESGAPHVLWMIRFIEFSQHLIQHLLIRLPQHHSGVDSLKQS